MRLHEKDYVNALFADAGIKNNVQAAHSSSQLFKIVQYRY
jgi:hypothetical protein